MIRFPTASVARLFMPLVLLIPAVSHAQSVSAVIPYNCAPGQIAVNAVTNKIYVTGDHVIAIDGATNTVTPIDDKNADFPGYAAVNTKTNKIYVPHSAGIAVIDGATNAVTLVKDPKAQFPGHIAINQVTNTIYVANGTSLTVLDGATNQIHHWAGLTSDGHVSQVLINPSTNKIYVSGNESLSVVDGATGKPTFLENPRLSLEFPELLAIDTVMNKVYFSENDRSDQLQTIDGDTNALSSTRFPFGQLWAGAANEATGQVFIVTQAYIVVVDERTNTVLAAIDRFQNPPGYEPFGGIAVDTATNKAYSGYEIFNDGVTGGGITLVEGLNPQSPYTDIGLPQPSDHVIYPYAMAMNAVTNKLYVVGGTTAFACGNINVIEGAGLVGPDYQLSQSSIAFGARPLGVQAIKHIALTAGSKPVQFSSVKVTGQNAADFQVSGFCPAILPPVTACTYTVTFQPTGVGMRTGQVVFTPQSGLVHTIAVSGPGHPAIPAGPLSFDKPVIEWGPVNTGATSNPIHIHVSNPTPGVTASLAGVTLAGRNANDFRIVTNTCPATIPFSGQNVACEVDVVFSPTAAGGRVTNLVFADNGSNPGQYIPIEGPAK